MNSCDATVGSRPWWMGVDQYDGPCACILAAGHAGAHECSHTASGDDR